MFFAAVVAAIAGWIKVFSLSVTRSTLESTTNNTQSVDDLDSQNPRSHAKAKTKPKKSAKTTSQAVKRAQQQVLATKSKNVQQLERETDLNSKKPNVTNIAPKETNDASARRSRRRRQVQGSVESSSAALTASATPTLALDSSQANSSTQESMSASADASQLVSPCQESVQKQHAPKLAAKHIVEGQESCFNDSPSAVPDRPDRSSEHPTKQHLESTDIGQEQPLHALDSPARCDTESAFSNHIDSEPSLNCCDASEPALVKPPTLAKRSDSGQADSPGMLELQDDSLRKPQSIQPGLGENRPVLASHASDPDTPSKMQMRNRTLDKRLAPLRQEDLLMKTNSGILFHSKLGVKPQDFSKQIDCCPSTAASTDAPRTPAKRQGSGELGDDACYPDTPESAFISWPRLLHSDFPVAEDTDQSRPVAGSETVQPSPPPRLVPAPNAISRHRATSPVAPENPLPLPLALPIPPPVLAWYRVSFLGGIQLRSQPFFEAVRTSVVLPVHQIFAVTKEVQGNDGRVYLYLASGKGWAFDDSALHPSDPSAKQIRLYWYRVAYIGGIQLRTAPSEEAPRTNVTLPCHETFAADLQICAPPDRRIYLRLADGRGWAFNDSALHPHDPSVRPV